MLDDGVARIGLAIDGMPEAHDLLLALQHAKQFTLGLIGRLPILDHRHGRLVGATVKRTTQ